MPQRYEVIITPDGQTVLARVSGGVTASVIAPGKPKPEPQPLNITDDEFIELISKSHTHSFAYNKKTKRVTATLKADAPTKPGTTPA